MPGVVRLAFVVALLLSAAEGWAAPAAPIRVTLTQSDTGATFSAVARGDEYSSWMETADGYTIVQQAGVWYLAQQAKSGSLSATAFRADAPAPKSAAGVTPHLRAPIDPLLVEKRVPRQLNTGAKELNHTQPVLVVLVDFANISFTYSDADFATLMFGASNSVKDFYLDNSEDAFVLTPATESYGTANDGIVHVTAATNHPNYGKTLNSWRGVAGGYLSLTNGSVDFSAYDTNANGTVSPDELSVVIITAGYENAYGGDSALTPRAWGHASSFTSAVTLDGKSLSQYTIFGEAHATSLANKHVATIGIMCHELGHLMLGLPDLYDIDGGSNGIGDWGLMGGGNWNAVGSYSGDSPSWLSAWCRARVGMQEPVDITSATPGASLEEVESGGDIYRLWIDKYKSFGQYMLLENRQQTGYDAGLPGGGLLVWHVDDQQVSNANEARKWIDLEEADGLTQLDDETSNGDGGDVYPGSSANTVFNDGSTPNSRDYSGASTGISVSNISASGAAMTADLVPSSGVTGANVTYGENGANTYWGYNTTTAWTAMRVTNETGKNTLDGMDINVRYAATLELRVYQSFTGTTPTTLLYTQSNVAATAGWNRVLFTTPQNFPDGAERILVVKIVSGTSGYFASAEATSSPSGRCYIDGNGVGAYATVADDWAQAALFSYVAPLALTAPNGGESWQVGTAQNITWTHNGTIGANIKLKLYKGGIFNRFLGGTISNTGSWSWTVPADLVAGADYDVLIYTPDYLYQDVSNARFTITGPPLQLTAPNGGESWQMGSSQNITWTHDVATGANVKFKLYKNGAFVRFLGGLFPNTDSLAWTVPTDLTAGGDYKIFVYTPDYLYSDFSNANFTITNPPLRITSPNGGETWQKGTAQTITWTYEAGTGASVKFKLYKGGTFLRFLSGTVANNGSFGLTVPVDLATGNDYQVLMYTPDYLYIDTSDAKFSVVD